MFHTIMKLRQRINELESHRYLQRTPLGPLWAKEDLTKSQKYSPKEYEGWSEIKPRDFWEGRDKYLWLRTEFKVPALNEGQEGVLLFDFGKTGEGHNSGFESLLFINDKPYQGVDSNHKEVFLSHEYLNRSIEIALKLWSGLEGGGVPQVQRHQINYADFAILSKETDELYFATKNILDVIELLDVNNPERFALQNVLEQVFLMIDWSVPGNDDFYASIAKANELLKASLEGLPKQSNVEVTGIGHTHIDVAWLWRLKHTREKAARSFSTVLKLMEKYDDYVFLQTQPQLYAYIKEDYPEIYEKIKEKVKEGKWEVDGAMWVEADCNLSSGESLVRQILHGSRFLKEEFGKKMTYLWLPDVFGYSWALPQILKKSGLDTFMTTKISWSQYNRMPHDTFFWRGIDGSEILTHFITTPDIGHDSPYYTYNGKISAESVQGIYNNYRNKDVNSDLLLSYGYGDGGGGVNREMLENRKVLDKIPGIPKIKTGTARDYFTKLHATVNNTKNYVHTWDGELYLEYHRGTYTSQAFVKKYNRVLELGLRDLEILSTLGKLAKKDWHYPHEKLKNIWEIVLRNQFHDIIPGSSIKEVYEDAQIEYEQANRMLNELKEDFSRCFIEAKEKCFSIFNAASWKRSDLVFIPLSEEGRFKSGNEILRHSKVQNGYWVQTKEIEPLAATIIEFVEGKAINENVSNFRMDAQSVDTPFYSIQWNSTGQLIRIYDKQFKREVLESGGTGNRLEIYEDKPMNFDAWDIDLYHFQKKKTLKVNSIKCIEINNQFVEMEFIYFVGQSVVKQVMVCYAHSRRIDFKTVVDWKERQQLLKASFDVNIRATEATYDIQYGNVKRKTHWNTSWDMAQFESVAHQWVDFSERNYGVALLNDCKYGHNVKDKTMSISLLKGAIYPDPEADVGRHEFIYSLLPHEGDFVSGGVVEEAWSLNRPFEYAKGEFNQSSLIKFESDLPVVLDVVKIAEDGNGVVVRLHEHTGSQRNVSFLPQFNYEEWAETNLLEEAIEEFKPSKTAIEFTLKPYEIKTFLMR